MKKYKQDIIAIFPLPIYKTNIEREFTEQEHAEFEFIISSELNLGTADGEDKLRKNISIDKYILNRANLQSIRTFIQHHLSEYAMSILGIDVNQASWTPHITLSWLNTFGPNNYDDFHCHRNCVISGVFYVKCLKMLDEADGIVFSPTSHHMLQEIDSPTVKDTIFSDKAYHVPTINGDLVLFPSTAQHKVNCNETKDQTRISLAFNVI